MPAELGRQQIPDYLRNRIEQQGGSLQRIGELFGDQVLARIPEFDSDITGLDSIAAMAAEMFGPDGGGNE